MKDEAAKRGYQIVYTDAAGSAAKQVADVNSMIAQGVDFIFLPPARRKPLIPAVMNAERPAFRCSSSTVTSIPRSPSPVSTFSPSSARISSQRVSEWRIGRSNRLRQGQDHRARGLDRASPPTTARRALTRRSRQRPGMVDSCAARSGDFARDKGRQVADPAPGPSRRDHHHAHNDEMALGAIAAIESAGRVPQGRDRRFD